MQVNGKRRLRATGLQHEHVVTPPRPRALRDERHSGHGKRAKPAFLRDLPGVPPANGLSQFDRRQGGGGQGEGAGFVGEREESVRFPGGQEARVEW